MLTKKNLNKIKKELANQKNQLPYFFDVLADEGRFRIFKLLMKYKGLCVSDIANILEITASAACQQLRILERMAFIKRTRMGQKVCYELNKQDLIIKNLINLIKKVDKN